MKRCTRCGHVKPLSEFALRPSGQQRTCQACCARSRRWQAANRDAVNARNRRWHRANPAQVSARNRRWRDVNRARLNARLARRRAELVQATPPWSIDFFVEEAYQLAQLRSFLMPFDWEVDHIVPLRHPLVCGLHAHTNLRVVPAAVNNQKGNRHWPDMPALQNEETA